MANMQVAIDWVRDMFTPGPSFQELLLKVRPGDRAGDLEAGGVDAGPPQFVTITFGGIIRTICANPSPDRVIGSVIVVFAVLYGVNGLVRLSIFKTGAGTLIAVHTWKRLNDACMQEINFATCCYFVNKTHALGGEVSRLSDANGRMAELMKTLTTSDANIARSATRLASTATRMESATTRLEVLASPNVQRRDGEGQG